MTDLRALQSNPAAFRAALLIDADGGPAPLAKLLDDWQAADFAALDAAWRRVVDPTAPPAPTRAWIERPRGHSKTADLAAMASWALFASRRPLAGAAAAADKDQARLLRDAMARLVALNAWLATILDVQAYQVVNKHTGSKLEILSADAASSYGLLCDFFIADEVSHWGKRDLWDSLHSTAAKRSRCLLLTITNAGWQDSWVWPLREAIRNDPAWLFRRLDGCRASWIDGARLGEQRRLLPPAAYARLWLNVWASGAGDALNPDDLARAITLDGPPRHDEPGWAYAAGLDLGLARDRSALVVVGRHVGYVETRPSEAKTPSRLSDIMADLGLCTRASINNLPTTTLAIPPSQRLRLTECRAWSPPAGGKIDLSAVEAAVLGAHRRYGFRRVSYDPWQAELLAQRLRAAGVPMVAVEPTGGNLRATARAVLEAFSENSIELFDDADLLRDLRACRVVEKSYGVRLEFPRDASGHGDRATAFALAVLAARALDGMAREVAGELIVW